MGCSEKINLNNVAVVIPTFNRREIVNTAIASALEQSFPPDEIIVVDDGSTDGTATALRECFPNITVLTQENLGVSAARNKAISESTSSWIAFLDSDDQWYPDKLEKQMKALEKSHSRLCHCDEHWIRNGSRVNPMQKHKKRGGEIFEYCLPLCAISPSAAVLHRSLFDEYGLFDESLPACEDYDLWLRITSQESVCFVDEALLKKTGGHDDQLSRRYPAMDRFRLTALAKLIRSEQLSHEHANMTKAMFKKKYDIYLKGAIKRGRSAEIERLQTEFFDLLNAAPCPNNL